MNEQELKELAAKYELDAAFVSQLYDKLTDKATIEKALRMFVAGTLKYDVAIGKEPIDIAAIRHEVAGNIQDLRKRTAEFMEKQKAIHEYYAGCKALSRKVNGTITDSVFLKFRNHDRAFFKAIKKHATKVPLSLFIFDERTIRKDKI